MKYSRKMAEKVAREVVSAYNRGLDGEAVSASIDAAEKLVLEIIQDARTVVCDRLEDTWENIADIEVEA